MNPAGIQMVLTLFVCDDCLWEGQTWRRAVTIIDCPECGGRARAVPSLFNRFSGRLVRDPKGTL